MSYLDLSIKEIHQALIDGKVTSKELVVEAIERAKKLQKTSNAFVTICEKEALEVVNNLDERKKDNLLWGIPYVAKDNFSTKNILSTASSNILKNYVPIYNAQVIDILNDQGAILIGKTVLDELAMGGNGLSCNTGYCTNPLDSKRQIGGSSAGSCAAVTANVVPFALGSDTGDSIRKPASFGGIIGFKPTWSRISRYGLFAFASSLDHVGFFTKNCEDSALVFDILNGYDSKDFTSSTIEKEETIKNINYNIKGLKIAVINQIYNPLENKNIRNDFEKALSLLEKAGATVEKIDVDANLYRTIFPVYMVISSAEATSNNACLDGVNYGNTQDGKTIDEVIINTRSNGFNPSIKRRFVLGSYILSKDNIDALFNKAKKIRRLIVNDINRIFQTYDAIILPATSNVAPLIENPDPIDQLSDLYLILENHMAIGNFGGFPSITIPFSYQNKLPVGLNITGRNFEDAKVLNLAATLEKLIKEEK